MRSAASIKRSNDKRRADRAANPALRKKQSDWQRDYMRRFRAEKPAEYIAKARRYSGKPEPTRVDPGHCECCGRLPRGRYGMCLDHDHDSGAFRGWLCHPCNRALGLLGDTLPDVLKLVGYLKRC